MANSAENRRSFPLRIAVRDLVHAPGTHREISEEVPAPKDFGVALVGVKEGSPMSLSVRLDSIQEGVLASGNVIADVVGECGRCLDPLDYELDAHIQELYYFQAPADSGEDDEDELRLVEDDSVDLEPVVRTAVVSALPFQPLCREDCLGLCSECGQNLNEEPDHAHEVIDPRWAALAQLKDSADTAE